MNRRHRRTINAVDLDNTLAAITPEMAAELSRLIPTAHADQLHAAYSESVRLIETAENTSARHLPRSGVDDWLRLGLLDTFCRWVAGTARTCLHMPEPRRPEPVWSCAWKPGLIVCSACLHLLKVFGDADKVCDCCGHVCTGLENGDGIATLTVWFGGLAYQAGACTGCNPELDQPTRKESA